MKKLTDTDEVAKSPDLLRQNLDKLAQLFPDLISETNGGVAVNVDVLKQLVGDKTVTDADEKYGLNWHGKRRARQVALTPSAGTLRPCPQDSVDWDTTKNLMIEGDNLEVLKLLQKSYASKVKLIYIDPPYNTGKDFVYPDNFQDSIKNYLQLTGQTSEGSQRLTSNLETSGRFHTAWLNMMAPRLGLARNLLRRDGAIFVSCDEGEQARLRLLMDEIFGAENFVADMIWAAGRKNDSKYVSISHEYIVCYARDMSYLREQKIEWKQRKKGLDEIYAKHKELVRIHGSDFRAITLGLKTWFKSLPDGALEKVHSHYSTADAHGIYFPGDISWPGGGGPKFEVIHPTTRRAVKVPSSGWRITEVKMSEYIAADKIHFGEDETSVPCIKRYLKDTEMEAPYSVFYRDGRAASKRLRTLMGANVFDFPKDEEVLREFIEMVAVGDEDIVMDFFAGSGTTGHSVMLQNAAAGGNRRYVLVQIPEPLVPDDPNQSEAVIFCDNLKASRTIATLTKERLRRAAAQVKSDYPLFSGDTGFRVFKLDSTNIREWDPDRTKIAESLEANVEHLKADRTEQDVLFELLLKLGLDLCVPIETRNVKGREVHSIGAGALIACLAASIPSDAIEDLAQGILSWHKELSTAGEPMVVFRDSAFADDIAKTNLTSILNQGGLKNVRSL